MDKRILLHGFLKLLQSKSKTGYDTIQKNNKVTFRIYSCST